MNHDMTNPTYRSWHMMRQRCDNPNNDRYHDYGGKGICYDPAWKSFSAFLRDMGERPSLTVSLDRKNNALGYYKENCRWATAVQQQKNTRDIQINNKSGVKGVYCEKGLRWRAEGIYAGVNSKLYQGNSFWEACLARWEWEFVTSYHLLTGEWI